MSELVAGKAVVLSGHVVRVLAPNPGFFTGPGTNSYLVGTRELAVIDPGPADPAHIDALLAAAASRGGRITHILCTHTHEDHSPGAALLAARTGARLVGSHAPDDGYNDTSFRPDELPVDGVAIRVDGLHLRALATPGHVSNHFCFLLEEERLLFTGDHLIQGTTVVIVPPEGSMRDYLDSLGRLQAMDIAAIAPGHGALMPEPQQVIAATMRHRLMREAKALRAVRELGAATLDALLPRVYDDVPVAMHPAARLSLEAHLIKLAADGVLSLREGCWRA